MFVIDRDGHNDATIPHLGWIASEQLRILEKSDIIGPDEGAGMKIGIVSDTHDHLDNLAVALDTFRAEGVRQLLHCGDLCSPDVVQAMASFDVRIARGNMDRHPDLTRVVKATFLGDRLARLHRFSLDGHAAAMLHGDQEGRLRDLIYSGDYAYIFHGHTHRRRDEMLGRTRVINPGALGGTRWQQRSFCIFDLARDEVRFTRV
jgi:hypothetical protein